MKVWATDFLAAVRLLLIFFLLAVLFSPLVRAQAVLNHSSALTALIQQADQTYARSANTSIQYFFNNIPVNAAVILGLAMHGQKRIVDQDPRFLRHYEALRLEAHEFLGELAKVHNFKNPYDGQPMDKQSLAGIFDSNASGEQNQWAVQNRLPDPAAVRQPFILDLVTPQSLAKPHLKDDANGIRLLDQVAPPGPIHGPLPQPNPPPVPQPEPKKQPVSSGAILGTWQYVKGMDCFISETSTRGDYYLEFRRGSGRDLYVGRTRSGIIDTFRIRSEKQLDPYTIEYTAVWENPHGEWLYRVHGQTIKITMYRGKKNGMLLCRGQAAGGVMSMGYLKVNN